jgi:hypothetical protein
MTFDQHEYDIRCEWGLPGVPEPQPKGDEIGEPRMYTEVRGLRTY